MINRDEKQNELVEQIVNTYKNGITGAVFIAVTGFGKTRCALKVIHRFNINKIVHVVVPTVALKNQWEEELINFKIHNKVEVFVINSYLNEDRKCDFLVVDEIHRVSNEDAIVFSTVIEKTNYENVLGLSATLTEEQIEFLEQYNILLVARVTLEEAVRNRWVSKYVQYNLAVKLTTEEQEKYTKLNNIMRTHAPYIDGINPFSANKDKLALARYCIEKGLDYKDVQMRLARYNMASAARKAIVYGAENKLKIIPEIVNRIPKKTIIFSETKTFAEKVHASMPKISTLYHSTLGKKAKVQALKAIKDNSVKAISTAKALDEGLDIPSLKCGIIASGTSTERQALQRIGRCGRYVGENEIAIIVNLWAEGTMEEGWLKKRQKQMQNIRWITKLEQIELI